MTLVVLACRHVEGVDGADSGSSIADTTTRELRSERVEQQTRITSAVNIPSTDRTTTAALKHVLFLDWDDTIFPTSWMYKVGKSEMEKVGKSAFRFLRKCIRTFGAENVYVSPWNHSEADYADGESAFDLRILE